MNIFKNKSVVRLYAFITACLIILVLLLCGINVCADGNTNLSELYDVPTDFIQDDGSGFPFMPTNVNVDGYDYNYFTNAYSQSIAQNYFSVPTSSVISTETYPHYAMCSNSEDMKFYVLPEDSFIVGNSTPFNNAGGSFVFYVNRDSVSDNLLYNYQFQSTVPPSYDFWNYKTNQSFNYNSVVEVDGEYYYRTYFNNTLNCRGYILNTDVPCYYDADLVVDSLDGLQDLNPSSPSISEGEDSTNNMYFKDYNISYSVSGLYSGNIVCYGDLNDYQKEHLDEFALTYSFTFDYSFYVPTVGGWTSTFTKNYSYQQTLSDFYNNGSSKVFTLKDIMQNINTQDIYSEYGNLYQLITHYANQGTDLNSYEVHWTKAKMKTTVFIVSANDNPSDILNSSDLHSNSFSKGYNFLDGKSSTYSDGITSNNNPYQTSESGSIENDNQLNNMDSGVTSSNIPSSQGDNGGSGTSVVTGDNNIVINNNPTFNNDGSVSGSGGGSSDGGVASTFYNTFNPFKTLFSSLNGDNSVISDDTAESIGANRFISVMSSTFSFIPEGMWTALTTFFIASLSILVVAVVIRVLLDLL